MRPEQVQLPFTQSKPFSIGLELELQLIDLETYSLTNASLDMLHQLSKVSVPGEVKPEVTQSMIEINTSPHLSYASLLTELIDLRNIFTSQAKILNIGIAGGGTHPFQKWSDQKIFPAERYVTLSALYGYLSKQMTIFGQHIHIGCETAEQAIYLCHSFKRFIPHLIALSAASPFYQGIDAMFDSSRLHIIGAFPTFGTLPEQIEQWDQFENYFSLLYHYDVVKSVRDLYWDVRPKPETGTIEIRICDTPLRVEFAGKLTAYAQVLAKYLVDEIYPRKYKDLHIVYPFNRFQACRFGLEGSMILPETDQKISIKDDMLATLKVLENHAQDLGTTEILDQIKNRIQTYGNDAVWLRKVFSEKKSLKEVVKAQVERFQQNEHEY